MLAFAQSILYSDLSDIPLSNRALAKTVCQRSGRRLGRYVKTAVVAVVLEGDQLEGSPWQDGRIGLRQAQLAWSQSLACLHTFPHLEHLAISTLYEQDPLDVEELHNLEPSALLSVKAMLCMPFFQSLTQLHLTAFGNYNSTFDAFGQLILAASHLQALHLSNVEIRPIFEPILSHMEQSPNLSLALSTLWVEDLSAAAHGTAFIVEDCIQLLPSLPSVRCFRTGGAWVYFDFLLDVFPEASSSLPIAIEELTMDTSDGTSFASYDYSWLDRLAMYFPALRRLETSIELRHSLPTASAFQKLQHLIINYPNAEMPIGQHLIDFVMIDNHRPPALSYIQFTVQGLSEGNMRAWFRRWSEGIKCCRADTAIETFVLACGGYRMTWVKVGCTFRLQSGFMDV